MATRLSFVITLAVGFCCGSSFGYDVNKDLHNKGPAAHDLAVILSGSETVTAHFDGYTSGPKQGRFGSFSHGPDGANTKMHWQNFTDGDNNIIDNCQTIHVGWSTQDHSSSVFDMYWTDSSGNRIPGSIVYNITTDWTYETSTGKVGLHWHNHYTVPIEIVELSLTSVEPIPLDQLNTENNELNEMLQPHPDGHYNLIPPGGDLHLPVPGTVQPGMAVILRYIVDASDSAADAIDFIQFVVPESQQKPSVPHLKWSQPPIEIDPNADTPIYCGWNEPSHREIVDFECWGPSWPYQCHGDADNMAMGLIRVGLTDLVILKAALGSSYPDPRYNPCADFDRDFVVGPMDVIILREWYNRPDVPADCPPTPGIPAAAGTEYWDLFAVSLSPDDLYWNLVNGGAGTLSDPLVWPEPAGTSVIDSTTPLGGVVWGFGGLDWGNGSLDSDVGTYSIDLKGESNYYLSVVLDTSTIAQHDKTFSSWGTISDIVVRPWDANTDTWGNPYPPDWVNCPFDPDNGTVVNPGLSSSVTLAGNNFGDDEVMDEQQVGIWGAAARLPNADGYKVDFTTDLSTWDSYDSVGPRPAFSWQMVADDFRCLGTMPITSIHWWGSYLGWESPELPHITPEAWRIGFWSNVSSSGVADYSHPAKLLWQIDVRAPRVKVEYVGEDYFPDRPPEACFQYHVQLPADERFWQHEFLDQTEDDIFWISIAAVYDMTLPPPEFVWGWKTRPWPWMDDAVTCSLDKDPQVGMVLNADAVDPIEDPFGQSVDLAFELDTDPNFIKWEQAYDSIRHWPHYEDEFSTAIEPDITHLVADDWPCDTNGPVSSVVWWGSYLGYRYEACQIPEIMPPPVKPDYFLLNIWTDVPAGTDPCVPFSHPNEIIWEYRADDYDEVLVGFDKHPEQEPPCRIEPVFRYSVRIPESDYFWQEKADGIYWLSVVAVYMHPPEHPWGWTNHRHVFKDNAVEGSFDSPTGTWEWQELYDQTGTNQDMSFMLFSECLSNTAPEYLDWLGGANLTPPAPWSKPHCWCYKYQCRGDADGQPLSPWVPNMYVSLVDLNILRGAINKMYTATDWPANGICADFDHKPISPYVPTMRVSLADLNILRQHINVMDMPPGTIPPCDQPPIITGPYNFWVSP